MTDTLECNDINVSLGGLNVLSGISLSVDRHEILGLIGPNGAGKTTLVNVLTGFQRPLTGSVTLSGKDITLLAPEMRARLGLVRTFQAVRLFKRLSVTENVEVAAIGRGVDRRQARAYAREAIVMFGLEEVADDLAGTLPYGLERLVGIARAVSAGPQFLLLDEPAAGLDDVEITRLLPVIGDIHRHFKCGILLIEHNMNLVMGICNRVHVLDSGRTLAVGLPTEVRANRDVRIAYLGETED